MFTASNFHSVHQIMLYYSDFLCMVHVVSNHCPCDKGMFENVYNPEFVVFRKAVKCLKMSRTLSLLCLGRR